MMKMKGYYSSSSSVNSSTGSPKMNLRNDSVPPMNSPNETILMRYLRSGQPSDFDYSSSSSKSRPILNYHNSSSSSCKSPLSAVENLEDDVLVMDGILVDSNKLSKSAGKFPSPGSSNSSSNSAINLYKTELCMSWENSGACRYGHKCQFAHGKEEVRPIRTRVNKDHNTIDLEFIDPYYSPRSSAYSSGSGKFALETKVTPPAKEAAKSKLNKSLLQAKDAPTFIPSDPYYSPLSSTYNSSSGKFAVKTKETPIPTKEAAHSKFHKALPIQSKNAPTVIPDLTNIDWSPLDDSITVKYSSSNQTPSRKAVDDYIDSVLYGPTQKKRLPVFVDICRK